MKTKVAVGLSGGVDSTIAAYLLKTQGYEVVGITMSVWDNKKPYAAKLKSGCYSIKEEENIKNVKRLAKTLGIKHHVIDSKREYQENVLDYFCSEYANGKTPNPCVVCNRTMKFDALVSKARKEGVDFDMFATGHYVRIEHNKRQNRWLLKKAKDKSKDQSYFLWGLTQKSLSELIFPLGNLTKSEVRKIARSAGLVELSEKAESQDFISPNDYHLVFGDKYKTKPGDIVDSSGKILGKHKGVIYYTVGQRKGLGIGGLKEPLHVIKIDALKNRVIVGSQKELFSRGLEANHLNLISNVDISKKTNVKAKIRQQHKEANAELAFLNANSALLTFKKPQLSITPGQSVVFYDKDYVLGGGVISKAIKD
jgi:tRNA-uridine 2-sulfurtransferase